MGLYIGYWPLKELAYNSSADSRLGIHRLKGDVTLTNTGQSG